MPVSRNRKNHKAKVINHKQTKKQKTMSDNSQSQGMPEIRQRPFWNSHESLELSGFEFEHIYNSFQAITNAIAALNSILNNNIIKGKIQVGFEKLVTDPAGQPQYVAMTAEEQAPLKAEFQRVVEAAKAAAAQALKSSNLIVEPTADEVAQISKDAEAPKRRGRKPKMEVVK
jgi:hypothetical protein